MYDTGLLIECFHQGEFLRIAVKDIVFDFNRIRFFFPLIEVLSFSFLCLVFSQILFFIITHPVQTH